MSSSKAPSSIEEILLRLPEEKRKTLQKLMLTAKDHLPRGFEETVSYGMIGYVVPLSHYPQGYHAKKDEPLPFLHLAAQKHHYALYHSGFMLFPQLRADFLRAYEEKFGKKADLGKACLRLKRVDDDVIELLTPNYSR